MYLTVFIVAISLMLGGFTNPTTIAVSSKDKKASLYQKIQVYDDQHKIDPIDAKVDMVWKAIPGYNGLRVNVKESYKRMEKDGRFDANKIVYKEIPPRIHLTDLEPEPIYKGNPEKTMVSLLINVAWGNEYIPKILEVLNDNQVKATFF